MSTEESTSVSQSPVQEVLDRAAESFPAFLMPRLVGVDHLMKSLSSARRRVNDSHKRQMFKLDETIGYEPDEETPATEDEEMGGISVAGDTHITISSPVEKAMETAGKAKTWATTIALAAAMLGGGAGIGYFVSQILKPQPVVQPPAATDTDSDTITEFDFP